MSRTVQVVAPSRLHFGMFSFGRAEERQFGGVGVMIERPGLQLVLTASDRFEAHGPLADRVEEFARRVSAAWSLAELPGCRIEVTSAPPQHVGLGVGTQLGLSVAAGLNTLLDRTALEIVELARSVGRGQRSAVGTHGFARGGMVVEAGKVTDVEISPQTGRALLPAEWRFVLVRAPAEIGLYGNDESQAFAALPPVPAETTDALCRLALLHLLPEAEAARFDKFSESLFRYGRLAGECFAAKQGGPFASPRLAGLVETIRGLGIRGVGQSSWGPTVFALLPDEHAANDFVERLRHEPDTDDLDVLVTAPNNTGAQVEVL